MPSIMGPDGFSRGKTVFVLAVVVGCFAILWPKVFFPMFTASIGGNDEACCDVISEKDTNAYHIITELCQRILNHDEKPYLDSGQGRPPSIKVQQKIQFRKPMINVCRNEIKQQCGVDVALLLQDNSEMTKEFRDTLNQLRSFNTSHCLKISYGVDVAEIGLQRMTKAPHILSSHMRPERPFRPEMIHPALREKGRGIPSTTTGLPRRTIEREARPGPVPGVRPPVAQAAHITQNPKGSGTMGIVMPMYTIGIVCFFVYTLMKILFKKPSEEVATTIVPPPRPQPILKDYGMDPEHRKFLHSEEYVNGSERSIKDELNKGDRELGIRRKGSGGSRGRFQEDRRRLGDATDQIQDVLLSQQEKVESAEKAKKVEGGVGGAALKESEPEPVTALSGIIQQLQVEQASALEKAKQVETEKTLTKKAESESKKKKEIDIDLEQMRTSKETLEVVAEEGKKPAKSRTSAEKEVKFQLPPEEDEEEFEEEEEEEEEELVRPPTPPKSISKKSKHAIKAEKGLINSRKGPASSRDVEDLSKKGVKNDEDDADLSTYLTAEADNDGQKMEDTAGDISVMDGLEDKHEELPRDEE